MTLVFWILIGIGCVIALLIGAFLEWYEHRVYYRTVKANLRRLKKMNKLGICNYVLLAYVCILVFSWVVADQTSKYLFLVELGSLLVLLFICEYVHKKQKQIVGN